MSTNVYKSEQVVHYSDEGTIYYGFYISWSGGEDDSAYPFTTAERREDWVNAVRPLFTLTGGAVDEYEALLAAAMLACATWGPESTREGIDWAFGERYEEDGSAALEPDIYAALRELPDRFDPSEPAGTPLAEGGAA